MICTVCGTYHLRVPLYFCFDGNEWRVKCELCLLWRVRALADGCQDMGVGMLIGREGSFHRVGSGLPVWLQNIGGPKQILKALDRRAGPLFDTVLDRAWEHGHE